MLATSFTTLAAVKRRIQVRHWRQTKSDYGGKAKARSSPGPVILLASSPCCQHQLIVLVHVIRFSQRSISVKSTSASNGRFHYTDVRSFIPVWFVVRLLVVFSLSCVLLQLVAAACCTSTRSSGCSTNSYSLNSKITVVVPSLLNALNVAIVNECI
jgi:hypothetical protein